MSTYSNGDQETYAHIASHMHPVAIPPLGVDLAVSFDTETRVDRAGFGDNDPDLYTPNRTVLAFDTHGIGSRATLAELAGFPGLVGS